MDRRHYLAATAGLLGGLAGCSGSSDGGATPEPTPTTAADGGGSDGGSSGTGGQSGGVVAGDVELPVPRDQLSRGAPKDAIPAITEPKFASDWGQVDVELEDDFRVIGVERGGEARAYPLRILNWHEITNDTFKGPLLVTFCPLCGSGVTAIRKVDGEVTTFGVSGLLWMSDLVMYDQKTGSLWSQILGQAINGPRTGERLQLVPSTLTTWGEWRSDHADSTVLVPPPVSGTIGEGTETRDYGTNPYAGYDESSNIGIGGGSLDDDRLHPKAIVIGVTHDGAAKAYPLKRVKGQGAVNDAVNGLPVVVAVAADGKTLVAYERTVDGETLEFERADERHLAAGGSRWRIVSGRAVDGPHEGTTLTRANDVTQQFWFAWVDFNPETALYGG